MRNLVVSSPLYAFDDITLVPQKYEDNGDVVDTSRNFFGRYIKTPVISAPMTTISGMGMVKAMYEAGAVGVHHRDCPISTLSIASVYPYVAVCPSMGIDNILEYLGKEVVLFLDVAHGHTKKNLEFAGELVKAGRNVVSGNIVTAHAAADYISKGVLAVKVGIGSGSVCSTRVVTGVGVPQAYAIRSIYEDVGGKHVTIISDGGHRTTGDIVKALAMGADFVMLGRMLAGTTEAEGGIIYSGMASKGVLEARGKERGFVEGISTTVSEQGSVKEVVDGIKAAIESAMYYLGCHTIDDLRQVPFELITGNAYVEGLPKP